MRDKRNKYISTRNMTFHICRCVLSEEVQKLVSIDAVIDGKAPKNPNDLDIAKDGKIYWSDSSTNVFLQDATIEFFGEPSGR